MEKSKRKIQLQEALVVYLHLKAFLYQSCALPLVWEVLGYLSSYPRDEIQKENSLKLFKTKYLKAHFRNTDHGQ